MERFEGKHAVVTGGSSGIGLAVVKRLAQEGGTVTIWDLKPPPSGIEDDSGITFRTTDITDYEQVKERASELSSCEILINCAGVDVVKPFVETTPEEWRFIIDTNLFGVFNCTHALIPLLQAGPGTIVNVASDAGRVGSSNEAVYSAAKGGVIAFTKTLARELVKFGIRVNCVSPGPTATPLLEEVTRTQPSLSEALVRAIPMKRPAEPDEVAAAILFLASRDSSYVTGQTLSVSGGLTMI